MQRGFYFDQTRCTGCFACGVACKDWHDIPAGPVHWRTVTSVEWGVFPDPFLAYLSESCYHCESPGCLDACPVGAISKRGEDGIVVVDSEACLGRSVCGGRCREACPYGAPQFAEGEEDKMQKCDLCLDRLADSKNPVCVDACPLRALDAGSMEQLCEKYGKAQEAVGFRYAGEMKPSVIFKGKKEDKEAE